MPSCKKCGIELERETNRCSEMKTGVFKIVKTTVYSDKEILDAHQS